MHGREGLASPRFHLSWGVSALSVDPKASEAHLRDMKRQVRLSTKRYSRAKLRFCAVRNLRSAQRNAYFIQLSKSARFDRLLLVKTSPRQAERETGLEPIARKNSAQIKNPATSAGRIRPSLEVVARRASRTDVLEARFQSTRYS
jgi:hypothetical protein